MKKQYITPLLDFDDMDTILMLITLSSGTAGTTNENGTTYIEAGSKESSPSIWVEE